MAESLSTGRCDGIELRAKLARLAAAVDLANVMQPRVVRYNQINGLFNIIPIIRSTLARVAQGVGVATMPPAADRHPHPAPERPPRAIHCNPS